MVAVKEACLEGQVNDFLIVKKLPGDLWQVGLPEGHNFGRPFLAGLEVWASQMLALRSLAFTASYGENPTRIRISIRMEDRGLEDRDVLLLATWYRDRGIYLLELRKIWLYKNRIMDMGAALAAAALRASIDFDKLALLDGADDAAATAAAAFRGLYSDLLKALVGGIDRSGQAGDGEKLQPGSSAGSKAKDDTVSTESREGGFQAKIPSGLGISAVEKRTELFGPTPLSPPLDPKKLSGISKLLLSSSAINMITPVQGALLSCVASRPALPKAPFGTTPSADSLEVHLSHNLISAIGAAAFLEAMSPTPPPAAAPPAARSKTSRLSLFDDLHSSRSPSSPGAAKPAPPPLWLRLEWNFVQISELVEAVRRLAKERGLVLAPPPAKGKNKKAGSGTVFARGAVGKESDGPESPALAPFVKVRGGHVVVPWIECQKVGKVAMNRTDAAPSPSGQASATTPAFTVRTSTFFFRHKTMQWESAPSPVVTSLLATAAGVTPPLKKEGVPVAPKPPTTAVATTTTTTTTSKKATIGATTMVTKTTGKNYTSICTIAQSVGLAPKTASKDHTPNDAPKDSKVNVSKQESGPAPTDQSVAPSSSSGGAAAIQLASDKTAKAKPPRTPKGPVAATDLTPPVPLPAKLDAGKAAPSAVVPPPAPSPSIARSSSSSKKTIYVPRDCTLGPVSSVSSTPPSSSSSPARHVVESRAAAAPASPAPARADAPLLVFLDLGAWLYLAGVERGVGGVTCTTGMPSRLDPLLQMAAAGSFGGRLHCRMDQVRLLMTAGVLRSLRRLAGGGPVITPAALHRVSRLLDEQLPRLQDPADLDTVSVLPPSLGHGGSAAAADEGRGNYAGFSQDHVRNSSEALASRGDKDNDVLGEADDSLAEALTLHQNFTSCLEEILRPSREAAQKLEALKATGTAKTTKGSNVNVAANNGDRESGEPRGSGQELLGRAAHREEGSGVSVSHLIFLTTATESLEAARRLGLPCCDLSSATVQKSVGAAVVAVCSELLSRRGCATAGRTTERKKANKQQSVNSKIEGEVVRGEEDIPKLTSTAFRRALLLDESQAPEVPEVIASVVPPSAKNINAKAKVNSKGLGQAAVVAKAAAVGAALAVTPVPAKASSDPTSSDPAPAAEDASGRNRTALATKLREAKEAQEAAHAGAAEAHKAAAVKVAEEAKELGLSACRILEAFSESLVLIQQQTALAWSQVAAAKMGDAAALTASLENIGHLLLMPDLNEFPAEAAGGCGIAAGIVQYAEDITRRFNSL